MRPVRKTHMFTQLPNTTCEFQGFKNPAIPVYSVTATGLLVKSLLSWLGQETEPSSSLVLSHSWPASFFYFRCCSSLRLSGCGNTFSSQKKYPQSTQGMHFLFTFDYRSGVNNWQNAWWRSFSSHPRHRSSGQLHSNVNAPVLQFSSMFLLPGPL